MEKVVGDLEVDVPPVCGRLEDVVGDLDREDSEAAGPPEEPEAVGLSVEDVETAVAE